MLLIPSPAQGASFLLSLSCLLPALVAAQVTVYNKIPLGQTTTIEGVTEATPRAAYDDTVLIPPPVPSPAPATTYTLALQREAAAVQGLSIPHLGGGFFGFSIEMSVINQVLGKNSSLLQIPFLNLMANIQERAGSVLVRLGGNTQEYAYMVDSLEGGHAIAKEKATVSQTTETPAVIYTMDLFYIAGNITSFINVQWFVGIPFNDTNWRFAIAENAQSILGDSLLGIQAGNEPDYYGSHGLRPETYGPYDYFGEMGELINAIAANDAIPRKNILIAPSVASGPWTPEQIWDTGFLPAYSDHLYALTVEHYPNNNCFAVFGVGAPQDPQQNFPNYLNHNAGVDLIRPYLNTARIAQEVQKPFIMFETNTATCGGFPGVSNSYGAALWGMDYGFQMAASNFSNALFHVGGQNVYYNPFTAPPTNQSTFNEWSVGAVYYSALVIAEAFGKSNTSRIVDLWGNAGNIYTPSYAIYENDALSKVALFNYVDDATGASDLNVALTVPNAGVPASIRVKYLEGESVSLKNITWAGQTFGGRYQVDGRLKGELNVTTIQCDQAANTCTVPVPAPGFALVFFNGDDEAISMGQATATYATTARTKGPVATVPAEVLATSNGNSGKDRQLLGSTSAGSVSGAQRRADMDGLTMALVATVGTFLVGLTMLR